MKAAGLSIVLRTCLSILALAAFELKAANALKLDTTSMATNSANWSGGSGTGGTVTSTDIGEFGSTPSSTTLASLTLGGVNASFGGLQFDGTMAGPVTIGSGNSLILGTSGLNMSSANQDVTINCTLGVAGSQTLNIGSGRTLTLGASYGWSGAASVVTKSGTGSLNAGTISAQSSGGGEGFLVTGGSVTATSVAIGRNSGSAAYAAPSSTGVPGTISTANGFYVGSGANTVSLSTVTIGTQNSGASGRVDGGTVTLSGAMVLGKTTSGGRYSVFQINGGSFTSSDTTTGLQIGPNNGTTLNNAVLYLSGGTTTFEKIGFGASTDTGVGNGYVTLAGGTLYVGSGGILKVGSVDNANIDLNSGILGAKADWSSSLPMNLNGNVTIQAADASSVSHNITLSGAVSTVSGNTGSLTKTGSGTLTLSAANIYNGNTTNSVGTLALGAAGSIASPVIYNAFGATFDVSALSGFTFGGTQTFLGAGTVNGSVGTTSGTKIYAGTDGGYGTNVFNNNLTFASGALCYLDLGTSYNGTKDMITVGGTMALNGTAFHLKAPGTSANLDTSADYVLITATGGISGTFTAVPVWDVQPANYANFVLVQSGNSIVLHYSTGTPPSATATASPSTVNRNQSTVVTVNVTPGSASIASVVLDASSIGGSSSVTMVQSNSTTVYTNTVTVSLTTGTGVKSLPATITDTTSPTPLTASATATLTVINTQTWNGSAADDNWSSSGNWISGVSPVTGDFVTFAGTARLTPSMDAAYSLTGVAFDTSAGSFTLGTPNSSTLTLTANGITNNSANVQVVNVPVNLSAAQTFNAAASDLTIGQSVNNGGNLLTIDGTHITTMNGVISGSGGLTKAGSGTNILTAVNSYSGATTVSGGVLQLNPGSVVNGGSASIAAAGGAQLVVNGGALTDSSSVNVGAGSAGLLVKNNGTAVFNGGLTTDLGSSSGYFINIAGGSVTASSLSMGRCGILNSQPASGLTGSGLYVNGGDVHITGNMDMSSSSLANSSVSARIDGGSLTVDGTLTIGLNNGGRWSVLDINGGTFTDTNLNTGISLGGPLAGNVELLVRSGVATIGRVGMGYGTISDTAVINLTGGSLYVGSGGIVQVSPNVTPLITLNGGILGATNDWSSSLAMTLGGATVQASDISGVAHSITLNGVLSGTALVKSGNGILTLNAANTYNGGTVVKAGTLALGAAGSILVTPTISVEAGATFDVSAVTGGYTLGNAQTLSGAGAVNGPVSAAAGAVLSPGTTNVGTLTFNNDLTLNATSTNSFVVTSSGASNKVAVASLLTPGNSVIKVTSGTALYPGTNTLFAYGSISGTFAPTVAFDVAPVHPASIVNDGVSKINLVIPNTAPVAAPYAVTRVAGISTLKIALSTLSTNWSDADGDTISFVSASASTNGVAISTNGGYILYNNTNNVDDQFTYVISDPYGATATGVVNIMVSGGNGSSQNIASEKINNDGTITLNLAGIPGYSYRTQASTNLTDWVDISTNTAGSNGLWQVNDSDATNYPSRYYRTVYP